MPDPLGRSLALVQRLQDRGTRASSADLSSVLALTRASLGALPGVVVLRRVAKPPPSVMRSSGMTGVAVRKLRP